MSANPEVLQASDLIGSRVEATAGPGLETASETIGWRPEAFARDQIRSLVRRLFFNSDQQSIKQVVFSTLGAGQCAANICEQVGLELALETSADIAVVLRADSPRKKIHIAGCLDAAAVKSCSVRLRPNLWLLTEVRPNPVVEESGIGRYWLSRLATLRNEFEYAVIEGPTAGVSSEAELLGELTGGVVLVLGAHSTHKAVVRKAKERLESGRSRILGAVLSERTFPIPERIYQRL
jgi:hypothetical protein